MINVLGLALYGPLAASTRYRLGQFVPGLAEHGISLQIHHLLGDDYLRARFKTGALPLTPMLRGGIARLGDLWRHKRYRAAVLHCELFPVLPGWAETAFLRLPYVYDFDDAFYLKYKTGRMGFASPLLGRKFDQVMRGAAAITAGNRHLANHASARNPNVTLLPTVVDIQRYVPALTRMNPTFTVGWIGSPSTAAYLSALAAPLEILGAEMPLNFVVIGGKAPRIPNVNVIEVEWQESTEVDLINTFDVGVMPLPDDEWARGKCAFKLIQYMACAVPVVASPVGANADVVSPECGFLASSMDAWVGSLRLLRDDAALRKRMGEAGRQRVVDHYSLGTALPKMAEAILFAANQGGKR